VYDLYTTYIARPIFPFDRVAHLLEALEQGEDLAVANCRICSGVVVIDLLAGKPRPCPFCAEKKHRDASILLTVESPAPRESAHVDCASHPSVF
jgi:recombinational DNA repair protein RecR